MWFLSLCVTSQLCSKKKSASLLINCICHKASSFVWEIPWTEEPGGLQSMGSQKSRTQLSSYTAAATKSFCRCAMLAMQHQVRSMQLRSAHHPWEEATYRALPVGGGCLASPLFRMGNNMSLNKATENLL